MKRTLLFLLIAVAYGCAKQNETKAPDYALISGTISNTEATEVVIKGVDFKKVMRIDPETGNFADTLHLPKSGLYQFICGEYSTLYLENGSDLNLTVDAKKFDESIKYTGIGGEENNYLVTKFIDNEKMQGSIPEFFGLDESEFKEKVEQIKTSHLSKLDQAGITNQQFVDNEKQNLKYESFASLNKYERYHKSVTKNSEFKVSDDFLPNELSTLKFDDPELYRNSAGYKELAMSNAVEQLFKDMNDFQTASPEELSPIGDFPIQDLKNELISNYGTLFVSPGNPNMAANYNYLEAELTAQATKDNLKLAYERGMTLRPGEPSPEFKNYENHKGGETSLTDLRGKYVYIDVWATWCGPCIREIPSLKEIESKYHNRNIVFVSTSIDQAKHHDKWVDMVNNKQLGGTQLMADNDWQSQFIQDYGIEGIPRFILIDPEGKIVSADAPRPSNPKLVELFNELDI